MTSPNVDVTITGSESVSGAAARAQAAIDALHGRSVDVDINFRNGGAASGFASAAQRAAESAGNAFRGFSDHVNRANDDLGGFRDAARDAGRDLERIGRGQSFFNDRDVSNARSIRGEIERLSDTGSGSAFRQIEQSSGSLKAIESGAGGAGREMRALESGASRAVIELREVGGVFQSVDSHGGAASRVINAVGRVLGDTTPEMSRSAETAVSLGEGLSRIGGMAGTAARGLGMLGIAGLYSTAGAGIGAAAVGAMGFAAAVGDIASSAPTLSKAVNLVTDFGQEFRKVAPQTTALAMPGLENMSNQMKQIGGYAAQLGLSHMPEMFQLANTALAQVVPTARALEPAISPAVGAAENLVRQAPRIAGGLTPSLVQFSDAVSANSEGLGGLVITAGHVAGALATTTTNVLGQWGERLNSFDQQFPQAIPAAGSFLSGFLGAKDNQTQPGSPTTDWFNKWGTVSSTATAFAGAGALAGTAVEPGGGTLVGGLAGTVVGTGVGIYRALTDDQRPAEDPAYAAGRKAGATIGDTGATAPLYPMNPASNPNAPTNFDPAATPVQRTMAGQAPMGATTSQPSLFPSLQHQAQQPKLPDTHPFGQGNLSGGAGIMAQLNQEMQKTTSLAPQVGQSMQQSMSQAGSAAQQAASPFQNGLSQMQQHAQQFPGQVAQPMSQLAPQLAQQLNPIAPAMQQAMQQAMPQSPAQHLTQAVQDQVQPAGAAAANVGASTGQGFDSGMQKEETHTITRIRKWVEKIIDVAASGLDSHSPSRVFMGLGESVGQGMALGVDSSSSLAVQSTQSMIGQMTSGAGSALADQQRQITQQQQTAQQQIAQQQQQAQQAQQQATQNPFLSGLSNVAQTISPMSQASEYAKRQEEEMKRAAQTGDTSRLSPQQKQQMEQAQQAAGGYEYKSGFWGNANRHKTLTDDLGYQESTAERVERREQAHNKTAAEKKDERRRDHIDAMMNAGSEASVRTKLAHEFNLHGQAAGNGTADGLKASAGKVNSGVADMINGMIEQSKKRLGIASPSKVFAGIGGDTGAGLASGLSGAIAVASTAAMGVASDRGLQVGYRYAESMVTGMQNVIKTADYQASAVPQIGNDQAKSVLGALGYLGYAGSGAMISKINGVSFPAGGATSPTVLQPSFTVHVQVGDQPVQVVAARVVQQHLEGLDSALSAQVG